MPKIKRRLSADERFRQLIDDYNLIDQVFKDFERERERLRRKLRNIIRRRGRGQHNGNESSINAFDVTRTILDQDKVRELLTARQFKRCFKKAKYIQIEGGPLLTPPEKIVELGEPEDLPLK